MRINTIKIRSILSLFLIITFLVVFVSGIGLYLAPIGRIAKEIGWSFLGLDKWNLEKVYILAGFVMSALVIAHLLLNYKIFVSEIRLLFKRKNS